MQGRVIAALAVVYFIWGSTYLAVAIALDEPVTERALIAAVVIVGSVALITLKPRDSVT